EKKKVKVVERSMMEETKQNGTGDGGGAGYLLERKSLGICGQICRFQVRKRKVRVMPFKLLLEVSVREIYETVTIEIARKSSATAAPKDTTNNGDSGWFRTCSNSIFHFPNHLQNPEVDNSL